MEVLVRRPAWPWENLQPPTQIGTRLVHRQDRQILRAQSRSLARQDGVEWHCEADAYTLLLRRVIEAAARGEDVAAVQPTERTVLLRI
jgi:hypothetical protein